MSQGYQIPLRLEFRSVKMKWSVASVKVMGWRHEFMAKDHAETLQGLVGGLGADSVVFSVDPGLYKSLAATAFQEQPLVTLSLGELPPDLVAICKPPTSLEDSLPESIKGREIPALLGIHLESPSTAANPEQMRDEFFAMSEDLFEIARFANKWGVWDRTSLFDFSGDDGIGIEGPLIPCILPHQMSAQRAEYRRARQLKPAKWLGTSRAAIPTSQRERAPYFFAEAYHCRMAVEYLITLDHLRGARIAVCARSDCGAQYEIVSQHKRLYCSMECAHLVAVRRSRGKGRVRRTTRSPRSH
jgi:hypothetical protein